MERSRRISSVALGLSTCTAVLGAVLAYGQSAPTVLWMELGRTRLDPATTAGAYRYTTYAVAMEELDTLLAAAPLEQSGDPLVTLPIPMPDGSYEWFSVEESPILSPELQAQHPELRAYLARGLDDPTASGRLDRTPAGFHGMILSERGTVFIDPAADGRSYLSFWKADVSGTTYTCGHDGAHDPPALVPFAFTANNPSGDQLTTYRLAVSATGEYTAFFGGVAPANAQIMTTVNRVTGVYERELAIRLNLVATNVYTDPDTDPFTGDDVSTMRGENQTDLDANVGSANYDVGHIFSQGGGGGIASIGIVCGGMKAWGATSLGNPSGDVFDVDFVSHELGHQFAGNHTWTGNAGSCTAGQFVASAAYEPGSGSTIMAYAGICGTQDVQANSDDYFHTKSFDEMTAFRDGAGACGVVTATANTPPTVEAGPSCTVPQSTPFRLTAQGEDGDGDALTFGWEQFDLGSRVGAPVATATSGPLFRSRDPSSSSTRVFPRFEDILSGAPTPWEVLPAVDRTLNFRVTARDNRSGGGGVDYDSTTVVVSGAPFRFTSPSAGGQLECGDSETISWNVGGGSIAPNVEILLSTDGGSNFSTLVGSAPNDGSHTLTGPTTLTADGRLMLEPSAECFFAVSPTFSIADTLPPFLALVGDAMVSLECGVDTYVELGADVVDQCDATVTTVIGGDTVDTATPGTYVVTYDAQDASGNDATQITRTVDVVDTMPPAIHDVAASPNVLWPPNHRMHAVSLAVDVTDECDTNVACSIVGVQSNESVSERGSGKTSPDWNVTSDLTLELRAERSGRGSGRIYTVTVECADAAGNTSTAETSVLVRHDRR